MRIENDISAPSTMRIELSRHISDKQIEKVDERAENDYCLPIPSESIEVSDLGHVKKLIEQAQQQLRLHTVQMQAMYNQSPTVLDQNFIPKPPG